MNQLKKKYAASIMGLVIGDALGVPVEFVSRDELKETPVTDMIGYGTHNQPAGTWSDDSSMAVATMEWLGEMEVAQPDYKQLMDKLVIGFYMVITHRIRKILTVVSLPAKQL